MSTLHLPGLDQDSAVISPCGQYRYALTRGWGPDPRAIFIMLNPSTADASVDDPTIRRCKAFAREWGCGALTVVNLYAWRATSPAELKVSGRDIAGSGNDEAIHATVAAAARKGWPVVAAWGANAKPARTAEVAVTRVTPCTSRAGHRWSPTGTTR